MTEFQEWRKRQATAYTRHKARERASALRQYHEERARMDRVQRGEVQLDWLDKVLWLMPVALVVGGCLIR